MKVSVITAVYNGEEFIEESILSVINQNYQDLEYIIVDGNSSDNTLKIVNKFKDHISHIICEDDTGLYEAWNKGLRVATGDWICFIGADDFFHDENVISKVIESIDKSQKSLEINYVYGLTEHIKPRSKEQIDVIGEEWSKSKGKMLKIMSLMHCGSFHHKSLFEKFGNFDESFKIAGDYEFLLRPIIKDEIRANFIENLIVVKMRNGGLTGSLRNRLLLVKELNRARKTNGLNSLSLPLLVWMIRIRVHWIVIKIFGDKIGAKLADFYRLAKGKKSRWA